MLKSICVYKNVSPIKRYFLGKGLNTIGHLLIYSQIYLSVIQCILLCHNGMPTRYITLARTCNFMPTSATTMLFSSNNVHLKPF